VDCEIHTDEEGPGGGWGRKTIGGSIRGTGGLCSTGRNNAVEGREKWDVKENKGVCMGSL
jgi:hypothetical protein